MLKILVIAIACSVFNSCNKNNSSLLELEILNDTLIAFSSKSKKDTINVVSYSIVNNSNNIYFFNQGLGDKKLLKKIYKNGIFITVYDKKNNIEVSYYDKLPYEFKNRTKCDSCYSLKNQLKLIYETKRLNDKGKIGFYATRNMRHYFFIHPKEKIFFKEYINLTDSLRYEDTRYNYAMLKNNTEYYSKFYIPSDSTNYKNELPSNILKTIEVNKAKVYHGIIESKNKVPIKVIE